MRRAGRGVKSRWGPAVEQRTAATPSVFGPDSRRGGPSASGDTDGGRGRVLPPLTRVSLGAVAIAHLRGGCAAGLRPHGGGGGCRVRDQTANRVLAGVVEWRGAGLPCCLIGWTRLALIPSGPAKEY